jgi:glycosyltransferase involved in cell wall biosynthesis
MLPMRIAQLAPPWIAIPPQGYGGTEWVVKHLCDGLVERGHEVHLFATRDSRTRAELHSLFGAEMPGRLGVTAFDARHVSWALDEIRSGGFDVVHDHSGFLAVAFGGDLRQRMVHTVHCALDDVAYPFYEQFARAVRYVSISDFQRTLGPADMRWAATVYNALPIDGWPYREKKDDYLLAFGRVCHAKGFHLAIEVAKRTGSRLVMAGVVQDWYRDYYDREVAPHVDGDQIVFLGEVSDDEKRELFAGARAFVFPILWPEPFGIVMIEAMASGTPVLALRHGSVPEVVEEGVNGFVRDDVDGLVAALNGVDQIDPAACRATVAERFSVAHMAEDYEAVYERLLANKESL